MKVKYVNKLWKGQFVSIRDYELEDAIREEGLEVHYNGDYRKKYQQKQGLYYIHIRLISWQQCMPESN